MFISAEPIPLNIQHFPNPTISLSGFRTPFSCSLYLELLFARTEAICVSIDFKLITFNYCEVAKAAWHLKSQVTWLFVKQIVQGNIKENIKDPYHWPPTVVYFDLQTVHNARSVISLCPFALATDHDDVIKWKHFPRNWPFVRGIHRSRWIPHTKASDAELWCFLWSASEYTVE